MHYIVLLLLVCMSLWSQAREYILSSGVAQQMPLVIALVGSTTPEQLKIAELCVSQLGVTGQFSSSVESIKAVDQSAFDHFCTRGISLVLFCEQAGAHELSWRLYNVAHGDLVVGKKTKIIQPLWLNAVRLADELWPYIANKPGFFSGVIAACKIERSKCGERPVRNIYAMLPGLSIPQGPLRKLTNSRSDNFAPRWHPHKMTLFFSQQTPVNIRLMAIDLQLKPRVITSFDGQNLTPAISPQGKVVLSLSAQHATHLYEYAFDHQAGTSAFVRLTEGKGYYASPSFISEDILVCEYMNTATRSNIGLFTLSKRSFKPLNVGRAHAPQAHPDGKIVFTKNAQGTLQVFVYDVASQTERQLTRSSGDKDEPSFSPCGNYVVFSVERKNIQQIAVADIANGREWILTPASESWSYPHWTTNAHLGYLIE